MAHHATPHLKRFEEAQEALEAGNLSEARDLFEGLDYDELKEVDPDEALGARVLALQLAILQERHTDAMYHADAALDLAPHEPIIHHLAGQALWARGHHRTAAELLIYAAELLDGVHADQPAAQFTVDASQIYYLAAEACRAFEQNENADAFYQKAMDLAQEQAGQPL